MFYCQNLNLCVLLQVFLVGLFAHLFSFLNSATVYYLQFHFQGLLFLVKKSLYAHIALNL